ncbi:OmpA family protein [Hyalangium versicolor]|uniref:OmpA family protein n=1 Tax=Hyalangium versicolor TaxID=2861190 RepID=UPI001CCAB2C2|nr:OmpA family protein [Hyalangium versicolor]
MRGLLREPCLPGLLRQATVRLVLVCALVGGFTARADHDPFERSFDAVPVKATAAQDSGIALEGARPAPVSSLRAALLLDFNLSILSLKLGEERLGDLIPYRLDAHALFAYQLHPRVELAADLPFTVYQGDHFQLLRDALAAQDFPGAASVSHVGLGDLRLIPRFHLLDPSVYPVGLALVGEVRLPTGDGYSFLGERRVLFAPRLAVERSFGPVRLLGNVGWRFRRHAQYLNLYVDDEFTLGAGAVVDLPDVGRLTNFQALAEMHLSTPSSAPFNFSQADSLKTPWEALVGARARISGPWGLTLNLGRGIGLHGGYGREAFRVMVALTYEESIFDADGDGVPDSRDKCPTEKEDRDGFQDDDGCPDPDNDGDGIADGEDSCPDKAGPKELKGCPENMDSDGDGVPDHLDACPQKPGPKELKGCPADLDSDGDGIPDHLDACPQKPGPKEYEGCPDSDGDEVPDNEDECPDMFGPPENNGCPYDSPPYVVVESDRIRIKGNILFETGQAKIRKQSFKLLDEVASVLARNPELGPVLIEGHTDNVGARALNLDLSNRRAKAVLDYLVGKGIARKRLRSQGFGFERPIAPNTTPLGRAKNRRVEFRLVKDEVETPPHEVPAPATPPVTPNGAAQDAKKESAPAAAPTPAPAKGTAPAPAPAAPKETKSSPEKPR